MRFWILNLVSLLQQFMNSIESFDYGIKMKTIIRRQGGTICGLSSLASFLKILSSKRVCCVFRDIRDKNAVNQGFWSKTAVFSLPATKVHCFLIFWLPHLYNLLQPGIRKQQKYTSIHEYLYLAINKAKFALLLFQPSHCSRVILEYLRIPKNTKIQGWRIEDWGLRTEDWGLRTEDRGPRTEDRGLRNEEWGMRNEDSLIPYEAGLTFTPWSLKNPHKIKKSSEAALQLCAGCASLP